MKWRRLLPFEGQALVAKSQALFQEHVIPAAEELRDGAKKTLGEVAPDLRQFVDEDHRALLLRAESELSAPYFESLAEHLDPPQEGLILRLQVTAAKSLQEAPIEFDSEIIRLWAKLTLRTLKGLELGGVLKNQAPVMTEARFSARRQQLQEELEGLLEEETSVETLIERAPTAAAVSVTLMFAAMAPDERSKAEQGLRDSLSVSGIAPDSKVGRNLEALILGSELASEEVEGKAAGLGVRLPIRTLQLFAGPVIALAMVRALAHFVIPGAGWVLGAAGVASGISEMARMRELENFSLSVTSMLLDDYHRRLDAQLQAFAVAPEHTNV